MYSFKNDYSELAHKDILKIMMEASNEQNVGYGLDKYSSEAIKLIKKHIKRYVEVHLLVGGTSTNKIVISHFLRAHEAVIAVNTGHINVHEAGAIENAGHKIITVDGINGKITPEEIIRVVNNNQDEHVAIPKMVYISNSTEIGTIYKKQELTEISNTCKKLGLYLFVDGARLISALTSLENDLTLNDIAELTDCFYIGGTKNGAMLGEAVVITNPNLFSYFRNTIKLNGGMLAKGYLIGMQFLGLFTDDLIFKLGAYANTASEVLKEGLKKLNVEFTINSPTNQQFILLNNEIIKKLQEEYLFEIWEKGSEVSVIRLVTSWNTDLKEIDKFIKYLSNLLK